MSENSQTHGGLFARGKKVYYKNYRLGWKFKDTDEVEKVFVLFYIKAGPSFTKAFGSASWTTDEELEQILNGMVALGEPINYR